jgi:hypothetical protein
VPIASTGLKNGIQHTLAEAPLEGCSPICIQLIFMKCKMRRVRQVGEEQEDHRHCVRAELDNFTPRIPYATSNRKPGSDLLFQASAAFAASAVALKRESDSGSQNNQRRAEDFAKRLYDEAKAQEPSIYSKCAPRAHAECCVALCFMSLFLSQPSS